MDNIGEATPPVYTTSDVASCATQDILPLIILIFILFIIVFAIFSVHSKNQKDLTEEQIQAEKLKEYKKLLDEGLITQEDYEEKKKQILKL